MAYSDPQKEIRNGNTDLLKSSFIAFLFVLWKALNLPRPTKQQIDMSRKLESGDEQRFILQAFRGIGKSFITCAYVVWMLWNNPQLKIMIVSASKERADANAIFVKSIIGLLPFLSELKPKRGQRDSSLIFDVGPALPDHSPSVKAVGITGQLTGSRADLIIADDVEVPNNSYTQAARDFLGELVKEFDAILKPDSPDPEAFKPTILYLGTPQTEMTLYRELEGRGYKTTIWPARYPADQADLDSYGGRLAPRIMAELEADPSLFGKPTDPIRFSDEDLRKRQLSYGVGGFALQFQLNPNLSDAQKYPLKLRDLIVASVSLDSAPTTFTWLPNASNEAKGLPVIGLKGDRLHRYEHAGKNFSDYQGKILVIDPSGRGKDETGYAVLYQLNGYIFLMDWGGFRGGYDDKTLQALADIGKAFKVNEVVIEGNFGDGMYLKLFSPVMTKTHRCAITEVKSKGQKELRIIDVLEPVMSNHRLVISESVIEKDISTAMNIDGVLDITYSGQHQMTRITKDKGALAHDDRLDALAIGVQFFTESMAKDSAIGEQEMVLEFLEEQLEQPMMGHDTLRTVVAGGISVSWEDEMESSNYLGKW